MIEIIVNGEKRTVQDGINIKEMILEIGYTKEGFALALNGTFVAIKAYEYTRVKARDRVEILSPVQGG